jgi:hypothetical protein
MEIEERISARDVERMIGVKTATLAKWRRLGKGPKGWREISQMIHVFDKLTVNLRLFPTEAL